MKLLKAIPVAAAAFLALAAWSQPGNSRVYDLGHYPGGTWAQARSINNAGAVVGFGDIPSGYTRPLAVPLFGPNAGNWLDLGTLGGDRADMQVMSMGVSDTGMIVGHSAISGGEIIHAFAWTPGEGMTDLGALGDGNGFSLAAEVNRLGNLIVGWSGDNWFLYNSSVSLPVVWTRLSTWQAGRPATTWRISKLDITGFETCQRWSAWDVNDFGQIVGFAFTPDGFEIAVLWNPLAGGEWSISQLPLPEGFANAEADGINEKGEIVGWVAPSDGSTWMPVLWKPTDASRKTYTYVLLASLIPQGMAEATGINDLGDIVGDGIDSQGNDVATAWSTHNANEVRILGMPGDWSFAVKVNDFRVAVGTYGSNQIPANVAAVQIR